MRRASAPRGGFTLIELMAVIVIIAILAGVLFNTLLGGVSAVEDSLTETYLKQIETAIESYTQETGDYPPSSFAPADVPDGGGTNRGVEALVVALWSNGKNGLGLAEDELANTDGDRAQKKLCDLPGRELLELVDRWGNPLAYFHHLEYADEHIYRTIDAAGESEDQPIKAFAGARGPYSRTSFQLISAGPDGRFGSDDDLTSFKRE